MNKKSIFCMLFSMAISAVAIAQDIKELKLKDFRPISIYAVPQSKIVKAKYPITDFHSHDYPETAEELSAWVKTMKAVGIEKSIILSYNTGAAFDSIVKKYSAYPELFEVWCGFDYTGMDQPDWAQRAVKELERCYKMGARGVGELGDKGLGELYSQPTPGLGMHINDPRMKPLLAKCAELHLPVSIHVAEDAWMYLPPDASNDGLMNAGTWHVDMSKPGILTHDQLVTTLEEAVRDNPRTTFIACHLANCNANLKQLGQLLDRYPNLYADIAARYGEFAPIPRFVKAFMEKYSDRLVYGTDMGTSAEMYHTTFRILESTDEHFYEHDRFGYHWPLYGLGLGASTLKKMYQTNARKIRGR
jgi:predicted TIM-barrel fold metal-dependent hydrolase